MKTRIMNYEVKTRGIKETLLVDQITGEKLMMSLSQPNCPRFIFINGGMKNIADISSIEPVPEISRGHRTADCGVGLVSYEEETSRELTDEEDKIHQQFNKSFNIEEPKQIK